MENMIVSTVPKSNPAHFLSKTEKVIEHPVFGQSLSSIVGIGDCNQADVQLDWLSVEQTQAGVKIFLTVYIYILLWTVNFMNLRYYIVLYQLVTIY